MNKTICCFWVLLIGAVPVGAAAETAEVPATLREAVDYALTRHLDVQREDRRVRHAKAQVGETRAAFWPSIDLVGHAQRIDNYDTFSGVNLQATVNDQPVDVSIRRDVPKYEIGAGLEASLNLYSGGAQTARLREAQANTVAAEAQSGLIKERIVHDVVRSYWQLRKAQADYERKKLALALAEEETSLAEQRFQRGGISALDKDAKRVRATEAKAQFAEAEYQRSVGWQEYRTALGVLPSEVDGHFDASLVDNPDTIDLQALLEIIPASEPALIQARAQIEAARWRERRTRSAFYPSLELFSRYTAIGRNDEKFNDSISDLHRQDLSVGVRLRWNLFNGTLSSHRLTQALEENHLADLQLQKVQRELIDEMQDKKRRIKLLENRLELAEQRLSLSQAQLRVAARRLELEQITPLQYKAEELALREATDSLLFAKVDLLVGRFSLMLLARHL